MQFTPRNLSVPNLNLGVKDSVRNIAEITFRTGAGRGRGRSPLDIFRETEREREEIPDSLSFPLSLEGDSSLTKLFAYFVNL